MRGVIIGAVVLAAAIGLAVWMSPQSGGGGEEPEPEDVAQTIIDRLERPDRSEIARVAETRERAHDAPDPSEIRIAPPTPFGLGWGWNDFHEEAIPTQCVEFAIRPAFLGQTSSLDFQEVSDTFELMAAMEMSAAGSVKTMAYEVEGESKFAGSMEIKGSALNYLIEAEILNAPTIAVPERSADPSGEGHPEIRLTDEAMRLARRDPDQFREVCGTGYVSATYGGAKMSIVASITTFSQAVRAEYSQSVQGGGWGVKVKAAMSGSASEGTTNSTTNIRFHQSGGEPDTLPTDPDEIIAKVKTLAQEARAAEKIFRIAVTPYNVLKNWPREDVVSVAEQEYEELAALWGSYKALYADLDAALDVPERHSIPRHDCADGVCQVTFHPASDPDAYQVMRELQDEVIVWLDRLEIAARECLAAEDACTTDFASYRSPYAIQVRMPINTCMLGTPKELEALRELYREHIDYISGLVGDNDDFLQMLRAQAAAATTVPGCDPVDLVEDVDVVPRSPVEMFADALLVEGAKSRCAMGTLTPGCLSNGEIDRWRERIGLESRILVNEDRLPILADRAEGKPCKSWFSEDGRVMGDPGTPLTLTIWTPPACAYVFEEAQPASP